MLMVTKHRIDYFISRYSFIKIVIKYFVLQISVINEVS